MIRRTFLKLAAAAVATAFAPAIVIAEEQRKYKFDIEAWKKWLMAQMEKDWNEAMDKLLITGDGELMPPRGIADFYYDGVPVYLETDPTLTKEQ